MQNAKNMSFGKIAALFAVVCALAVAAMGACATNAHAQATPDMVTVTYGKTGTAEVKLSGLQPGETVSVANWTTEKAAANATITKTAEAVANTEGKATVTVTVKGTNANYGKDNITVFTGDVVAGNKTFVGRATAIVKCVQATPTVSVTPTKIKHSTIKKKKVAISLKANSKGKVTLYKKLNTKIASGAKGATKIYMKKHNCKKATKSHTITAYVNVANTKNYKALKNVKKSFKIKMS